MTTHEVMCVQSQTSGRDYYDLCELIMSAAALATGVLLQASGQTDGRSLINGKSERLPRHATSRRRPAETGRSRCAFNIAVSELMLLVGATTLGGAIHR